MGFEDELRSMLREELRPLHEQIAGLRAALDERGRPTADDLLAVKDAARLASVSVSTIRGWIREGHLSRHGAGRLLRVRRADVLALLTASPSETGPHASADEQAARILGRGRARSTP